MNTVLTTCPFCACGCALYLQARDGRLFGVAPSANHPVSRGRLCARGWSAHEAPVFGKRLTRPLARRDGVLRPVSWSEALDEAASLLSAAVASGRTAGVLGSARATNEENYLAARLARRALRSNRVDSCLRPTWQPFPIRGTFDDVEHSDVVLVVEGDLARSHPIAAHAVMLAVKRGAALITIGQRRTQIARLARLHVPVVPGVRERVLSELALDLDGTGDGPLLQAARWFREGARASILFAAAAGPADRTAREADALAHLALRTGHLERAGSALLYLAARGNLRGACEMGVTPDHPESARAGDAWPAGGRETTSTVETLVDETDALVIVADDPPSVLGNGPVALAALQKKQHLVVLDAFMTPTVEAARVALPIATFAENDGTTTNLEGRVQRVRAAIPPLPETRPGWEVLAAISTRLGLSSSYGSAADVLHEIGEALPEYAAAAEGSERDAFGALLPVPRDRRDGKPAPPAGARAEPNGAATLAVEGVFDWGSDPLFAYSPTLSRDQASRRKLYPCGLVEMNRQDAADIGVRQGWTVRIVSTRGEANLPVVLVDDIERGVLLVPHAFRSAVQPILHGEAEIAVRVERAP